MNCKDFERNAETWLEGRAAPELAEHVQGCPVCAALAAELAGQRRWLPVLKLSAPEPGAAFWPRLNERLAAQDRRGDFWAALGWVASRAAVALALVVVLLAIWVWREPGVLPVQAAFDEPQVYLDDGALPSPLSHGQMNRDEVLLTLVSQPEVRK